MSMYIKLDGKGMEKNTTRFFFFPLNFDRWEPVKNLVGCTKAITEFEDRVKRKKRAKPNINDPRSKKIQKVNNYKYCERGMKNLGQTCYFNSVLQIFLNTELFSKTFLDVPKLFYENPINVSLDKNKDPVFIVLKNFFQEMYSSIGSSYTPNKEYETIMEALHYKFKNNVPHDALEFISSLFEEVKLSIFQICFNIKFSSCLKCCICFEKSFSSNDEKFLSVECVSDSLVGNLNNFFKNEKVYDVFCKNCGIKTEFDKRLMLNSLPNVLIIHLKRFKYDSKSRRKNIKNSMKVSFETNMSFTLQDSDGKTLEKSSYYLYAILCHKGSIRGHYYSVIRRNLVSESGKYSRESIYTKFNDTKVETLLGKDSIKTSEVFIFFYEKQKK